MKRLFLILAGLGVCVSASLAGYSDGFITTGEYEYGVRWFSNSPPLVVEGGGADRIEVRDYGRLEVYSTSLPDIYWEKGGIRDIGVDDYGELLYLGGYTDILSLDEHALAVLKGGSINHIRSFFDFRASGIVDLYCRPGWSWIQVDEDKDGDLDNVGITGLWEDGSVFNIDFIDKVGYYPVWVNINVIEVPEPASLLLISLGGLLICRKR